MCSMPNTTSNSHAWQHGLHRSTCKQPSFGQGKSKVSTSTSRMFFIRQDTSSKQPSAIAQFSQHHINSRALFFHTKNPHAGRSTFNIQHKNTTVTTNKYITYIRWTLHAAKSRNMRTGSPSKTEMKPFHELNGAMEELARLRLKQHAPHKLKTTWRRLLFGPCVKRVFKNTRHVMTVKTRGSSGTLFFSRPFRAFLRPFRAFSRPFRARPLDNIRRKMSTSCMSKPT
jgi:hypothetical protein